LLGNPAKAKFFFATPGDVAVRISKWFAEGTIWYHLGITLLEAMLAFAIGAIGGVLIGFWFARKPLLAAIFDPYVKAANSLPRVVLAPIFALWLGLGALLAVLIAWRHGDKMLYVLAGLCAGYGLLLALARALPGTHMLAAIVGDLRAMPMTMRRLAWVQFFSWFALFAMWIFTTAAVAGTHFGSTDPQSAAYNEGANWVGVLFGAYNGFAALAALLIPPMVRAMGLRWSHLVNLWLGGAGLISMMFIDDPRWLLLSMVGVGFAWASILSLPYALLSDSVPAAKMGVYMGIFNFFIVIPQLVAASALGFALRAWLGDQPIHVLVLGGCSLLVAGLCVLRVPSRPEVV